jgi:hypothetical protein
MRGILMALLLLTCTETQPAVGQARPDLAGAWVLHGDSVAVRADSAAPDSVPGPAASPGLRPLARPRGNEQDRRQLSRLVAMAQPVTEFTITQTDTAITLTNGDGFTYTVRPGGRSADIVLADSSRVGVRARWRDGALEIEFRPDGGGRIIETYHLSDSRRFLRLEVVVEHELLIQRLWRSRMYRRPGGGQRLRRSSR